MAAGISPALAGILRPQREQYNQQVRQRRHTRLGFDESAVTRLVRDLLDPIANQLSDRESLPRLIDSLFELGLELIAQRWIGRESRDPELIAAWFQLLQALPGVLLAAPTRLPAALFNALLQLRQAGADAAGWCRQLAYFGSTKPLTLCLIWGVFSPGRPGWHRSVPPLWQPPADCRRPWPARHWVLPPNNGRLPISGFSKIHGGCRLGAVRRCGGSADTPNLAARFPVRRTWPVEATSSGSAMATACSYCSPTPMDRFCTRLACGACPNNWARRQPWTIRVKCSGTAVATPSTRWRRKVRRPAPPTA